MGCYEPQCKRAKWAVHAVHPLCEAVEIGESPSVRVHNRFQPPAFSRATRSYRGEADADHQKGEAMDPPLLAIADGFGEGIGKVCETRGYNLESVTRLLIGVWNNGRARKM